MRTRRAAAANVSASSLAGPAGCGVWHWLGRSIAACYTASDVRHRRRLKPSNTAAAAAALPAGHRVNVLLPRITGRLVMRLMLRPFQLPSPIRLCLHCAPSLAAQCIVIGLVCLGVSLFVGLFVCLWVCYHDNSKLRASIFTKLGLCVKVVTVSSWLNFGRPAPPGRGLRRGEIFSLRLATASAQCLRLSERFFSFHSKLLLDSCASFI